MKKVVSSSIENIAPVDVEPSALITTEDMFSAPPFIPGSSSFEHENMSTAKAMQSKNFTFIMIDFMVVDVNNIWSFPTVFENVRMCDAISDIIDIRESFFKRCKHKAFHVATNKWREKYF